MFNQMLFSWLDFVRCVYIIWRRTIKSLDKFTRSVFCPHFWRRESYERSVPVSQDAECYLSICLLGKVHIPRVPGSWRALFSHTRFIIIADIWGAFMFLLRGASALTLRPGSPRSYCVQSLSALWSLRFIHGRVHLSPSCSGESLTASLKREDKQALASDRLLCGG